MLTSLWEQDTSLCLLPWWLSSRSIGNAKNRKMSHGTLKETKSSEVWTLFLCISLGTQALCHFCPNFCPEFSGHSQAWSGQSPSPWKLVWKLPGFGDLLAGYLSSGEFVPLENDLGRIDSRRRDRWECSEKLCLIGCKRNGQPHCSI